MRIDFLYLGSDFTYANIGPAGWSLGEICAGIVCACLPTLRPLLFRVVPVKRSLPRLKFSRYTIRSDDKQKLSSRASSTEERGSDGSVDSYAMETSKSTHLSRNDDSRVEAAESTESLHRPPQFRNVM